jgi:hypothetical protein
MKSLLATMFFLNSLVVGGQSPYLSILLKMNSARANGKDYKIEMKVCEPKNISDRGDWFSHEISKIDFASLKSDEINCGEYFDKGTAELISGEEEEKSFNEFKYANQVFAWEKIFVFRISNWPSRGEKPEMYIVIPMKYKSFVTSIKLSDIEFHSGKVIFVTDFKTSQDGMYLNIDQSLKNQKITDLKDFPLKEVLFQ